MRMSRAAGRTELEAWEQELNGTNMYCHGIYNYNFKNQPKLKRKNPENMIFHQPQAVTSSSQYVLVQNW